MATFTPLAPPEASRLAALFGLDVVACVPIPAGSVNSNFRLETRTGERFFARIYEEQDASGAEAEARLLDHLARGGVPTPRPLARTVGEGFTAAHLGRAFAVFPWIDGDILCQARVTAGAMRQVGEALARTHQVAATFPEARPGRFRIEDLGVRLDAIARAEDPALREMVPRIRERLDRAVAARDASLPSGIVHGDLFRDNVLWQGGRISALLDFESACDGSFAYDLVVTALSWCYGDDLDVSLVRALFEGYAPIRPLADAERAALGTEARIAALRFTITRITDFTMRTGIGERVMKDWRRFFARHERIAAMGDRALAELCPR